jgi:CheY-like chemotaxis protein
LQQVLKNLLSNAFKFTEQGQITLRIAPVFPDTQRFDHEALNRADMVIGFSVIDTGIGIPLDKQRVIFEAFQQADGTTSRKYGGTGLGLSISREIARLLGGEIRLVSAPGVGSTFTLYLPLSWPGQLIAAQRSPASPPTSASHQQAVVSPLAPTFQSTLSAPHSGSLSTALPAEVNINDDRQSIQPNDRVLLIIEDDRTFAQILLNIAHEWGFKGVIAVQGDTGLALARELRPDAILLDIQLPVMDGWTVLDRLKHDAKTRHIPVNIVSVVEEQTRGLQQGAIAHLKKPVSVETLVESMSSIAEFIDRPVKNLLIVEDNEIQRNSMVELIHHNDVNIAAVGTGAEALEALGSRHFDCIVLDLDLPDMTGFQLIRQLEQELGTWEYPIIVYTGMELTPDEEILLRRMTKAIILKKDVRSLVRLLDETNLFLHRVEIGLPEAKRVMLDDYHKVDAVLENKRILIVDDDIRNIFATTSILERHSMKVIYAENGRDCINVLQETPDIDAILMDIMMPELDGYETMRLIRQMDTFKSLPIIALTAKAMKGDREKCLAAGASDYITKPIDTEHLLSLLRVWLFK